MSQTTDLLFRIRQQGGEQLTRLQNSLKGLGQQASAANVNFSKVSSELRGIQAASTQSVNNLRGYANAWREIANSVKIGSEEFKKANAEAARLEAQLKKTTAVSGGQRLRGIAQTAGTIAGAGVFGGPEGALGAAIGSVGGVPGAIAGGAVGAQVGQLRQLLGSTAQYSAELSKLKIALEGVAGSQQDYAQAVRIADEATRQLNVPQEVAIQGMTRLTAAVKGAGGEVADAGLVFTNITKAIKGTGGSAEDVQGAITAMVQVFSKGKVSAEELSGQLGERLPGAVTLFAEANRLTLPELQKGLKDGVIGLNELMKFIELLGTEYGKTALKIAASNAEAGARLQVVVNDLKIALGDALGPIGAQFQAAFADFIQNITPTLVDLLPKLAQIILNVVQNLDKIVVALGSFATALAAIKIIGFISSLNGLTGAMVVFSGSVGVATTALQAMNIASLINPVYALAAAFAAVGVSLFNTWKEQEEFNKLLREAPLDRLSQEIDELNVELSNLQNQSQNAAAGMSLFGGEMGFASTQAVQLKKRIEELIGRQKELQLYQRVGVTPRPGYAGPGFAAPEQPKRTTFAGFDSAGAGGGRGRGRAGAKQKEPQDVAKEVLALERQIIAAKATGNNLLAAQLQFEKDRFEINAQRRKNEITANKQNSLLLTAGERLGQAALNRDRELTQEKETQVQFGRQIQEQIEEANYAAGLLTKQEKDQLDIARKIEEVRRAGRVAQVPENQLEAQIKRLKDALEAAANQSKTFGKTFAESFATGIKSMGDLANNLGQSFANIFSGMADKLAEFVTTGKANFADFARSVLADLSKIFLRFALFEALKAILPGGLSKGIFGFASGGIMTQNGPLDLRRYASGGIATSPQLALFGEGSRPEAYVPLPDGRTIPVTMKNGSTGETNVIVNVDAKGTQVSGDEGQAKALGAAISIAVQAEIVKQQRPGGILAGTR